MLFLIGLFVASMGVALSTKAGLGTSPVASVPYSISLINHTLTFGWWLNMWSLAQVAVQVILLRSKCKPVDIIIQIVLFFIYGYLTDFSCMLIQGIQAGHEKRYENVKIFFDILYIAAAVVVGSIIKIYNFIFDTAKKMKLQTA